ncbi:MAG TPA: catalase-peroxidase, partial [Colwellia sp.]|nr:catalase-peroxidase [Colwellia sp.]
VGAEVPTEVLMWQDPIPAVNYKLVTNKEIKQLKKQITNSGLTTSELVRTAWAAASSHRVTDMRGGANGARINLKPQNSWAVNNPKELSKVLAKLEAIQSTFNKKSSNTKVSLADVIVLGGATAIENAAAKAGNKITVPFSPGRADANQAQTNVKSFNYLKPKADGFRNYFNEDSYMSPTEMLIDKANMLDLNVPEMTVLLGGMRALEANYDGSSYGVFTNKPGVLSNDFFVNLLDMSTVWTKDESTAGVYIGHDRASGKVKWQATPVDLIFGSNTELRAVAEVYASDDADKKFVNDFIKAWVKVMQLDRFDLK